MNFSGLLKQGGGHIFELIGAPIACVNVVSTSPAVPNSLQDTTPQDISFSSNTLLWILQLQ